MKTNDQEVSPIKLLRSVQESAPQFEKGKQNCAGEFFDALATALQQDFETLETCAPSTVMKMPFLLTISREWECVACGNREVEEEAVRMLVLPWSDRLSSAIDDSRMNKIDHTKSCKLCLGSIESSWRVNELPEVLVIMIERNGAWNKELGMR